MSLFNAPERVPTHTQLAAFISSFVPLHPEDVPFRYNVPRYPSYDPDSCLVHDIVLSIVPTPGVYRRLNSLARGPKRPAAFLHRPFRLDRSAIPKASLVLASHKRFDEVLTVGFNTALASRLGVMVDGSRCIQGYKNEPDRRIGLVGSLGTPKSVRRLHEVICAEIGAVELHDAHDNPERQIYAIALMNAFGPDEVARAVNAAKEAELIPDGDASTILYLTGTPRVQGIKACRELKMAAACVHHQPCEAWGIKFLANQLKQTWTELGVHIILEDDEGIPFAAQRALAAD